MLVTPEALALEAPEAARRLAPLFKGDYQDDELMALWALEYLRLRHPANWWGAKNAAPIGPHKLGRALRQCPLEWKPEEEVLLQQYATLGDLWAGRAFKATPLAVHRSILAWSAGEYPLVLMERIPSVEEVLQQQMQGQRCVTIFREVSTLAKLILGERDALGFAFHDLIHADHFFHNNQLMRGQIGFYRQVDDLLKRGLLAPFMAKEAFPGQLDYLIADMNSHPVHLWKCFKSICRQADFREMEKLFHEELPRAWYVTGSLAEGFRELNGPGFSLETHAPALLAYCERSGH